MYYTDTHCHLAYLKLENYQKQPEQLLAAMSQAQVGRAMAIMCHLDEYDSIRNWVDLAADDDTFPDIGMSIGVHPCQSAEELQSVSTERLLALEDQKVWAFGETGLDYYWDESKKDAQKHSFATHIHASQKVYKPIVVHTRNAYQDTLDVLKSEKCEHGIIHCFTEDYNFAKTALDMGLYISFSGIVSFNKSEQLRDVAKRLPLDRILIETDSPYLAPVPKRGRDNEPTYVPYVAKALSTVFDKSVEEIGRVTSENFIRLLNQYRQVI